MNTNRIIRLINNTRKFCVPKFLQGSICRTPQPLHCMSTSVSVSQMGKEKETFQDVLPTIINSLVKNPKLSNIPEIGSWITEVLNYNLVGGKKTRGLTTVFAYEMLQKPDKITEESLQLSRILGWCVEMLQAYLLILDDIMDGSTTRRGVPCWYRLPHIGLAAINDSILVYCSILETLSANFGKSPIYSHLLDQFNEALFYTSMGQHLDLTMAHRNTNDYSLFTLDRYFSITKHKTSYYTYKLPVALGLILANNTDKSAHRAAEDICLELGKLFQIQDDYIDCFGDESVTGKKGTDIQEGKCSWLAVTALQRFNDSQRATFVECYSSKDPENVERIKQLYVDLDLPQVYKEKEREIYEGIVQRTKTLPSDISPSLFLKLLEMTYKRKQ